MGERIYDWFGNKLPMPVRPPMQLRKLPKIPLHGYLMATPKSRTW